MPSLKINKKDCKASIGKSGGRLYPLTDFLSVKPKHHSVMHFNLPTKGCVELHCHPNEEEIYYILSGDAGVKIDKQYYTLGEGDLLYIPPNKAHELKNIGTQVLKMLAIFSTPDALQKSVALKNL